MINIIPEFPNLKDIELSDKVHIKAFTSEFLPYSDFNFTAMWSWSWNTNHKMMISQLNKNLVVLFNDYVSGEYFLSFIGKNKISDTALRLITYSREHYKVDSLKLIPEEIAEVLSKSEFKVVPDRDSYDYVYSVLDLANIDTWSRSSLSKGIKQFIKKYPNYVIKQNTAQEIQKNEYLEMFEIWAKNKNIKDHFELNEYKAFKKSLQSDDNIKITSLYIDNNLVGFNTHEIISNNYANSGFSKANIKYHKSIYAVLNWEEAKILKKQGVKYYNWEQDVGIENLRKSKMSYHPISFLRKYKVSYNN